MEEWKEYKLGEIGKIVGGATPSTKDRHNYDGNIAWITPKDLSTNKNRYISCGERMISQKGLDSCSCSMLPPGSILFSSRAPIGYVAIAANELCTNQGFKSIVVNKEIADNIFIYYLLIYNRDYIAGLGSGTTFMEVSGKTMSEIQVSLPPLPVQKHIANILSSLDDKIELNRRINDNLEQQAQALFKSWFVDFEPWGGKMPEDWREYKLCEFMPVKTGKMDANVASKVGKYPFFSCAQDILYTDKYSFDADAILVAGNGDFNVKWYRGKFEAYQRTYVLIPHNNRYLGWLFYAIKRNLNKITRGARGSVIKFITKGNLEDFTFWAPIDLTKCEIIDKFNVINNTIELKRAENARLASIRDTLLPKLMSGELKIS